MPKKRKSTLKNAVREPEDRSNPFEQLHSKKRFNTLGRRSKNDRARTRSRHDAVDKVNHHSLYAVARLMAVLCSSHLTVSPELRLCTTPWVLRVQS